MPRDTPILDYSISPTKELSSSGVSSGGTFFNSGGMAITGLSIDGGENGHVMSIAGGVPTWKYPQTAALTAVRTASIVNASALALKSIPDLLKVGSMIAISVGLATCEYKRVVSIDLPTKTVVFTGAYFTVNPFTLLQEFDNTSFSGGDHRLEFTHAAGDMVFLVQEHYVNVLHFGAISNGDLSYAAQHVSNTLAFNRAFQQAYKSALNTVYAPGGKGYFVHGGIRVEQSTRLLGDKYGTIIYASPNWNPTSYNDAMFILYKNGNPTTYDIPQQNGRFDFVNVHCNGAYCDNPFCSGGLFSLQQNCFWDNCRFDNFLGYGVCVAGAQEMWLSHTMIVNCGINLWCLSVAMLRMINSNLEAGNNSANCQRLLLVERFAGSISPYNMVMVGLHMEYGADIQCEFKDVQTLLVIGAMASQNGLEGQHGAVFLFTDTGSIETPTYQFIGCKFNGSAPFWADRVDVLIDETRDIIYTAASIEGELNIHGANTVKWAQRWVGKGEICCTINVAEGNSEHVVVEAYNSGAIGIRGRTDNRIGVHGVATSGYAFQGLVTTGVLMYGNRTQGGPSVVLPALYFIDGQTDSSGTTTAGTVYAEMYNRGAIYEGVIINENSIAPVFKATSNAAGATYYGRNTSTSSNAVICDFQKFSGVGPVGEFYHHGGGYGVACATTADHPNAISIIAINTNTTNIAPTFKSTHNGIGTCYYGVKPFGANGGYVATFYSFAANNAGALDAYSFGAGATVGIVNEGSGTCLNVVKISAGKLATFSRNIATSINGVEMTLTNAGDSGNLLDLYHAGSGTGLRIEPTTGRAIRATRNTEGATQPLIEFEQQHVDNAQYVALIKQLGATGGGVRVESVNGDTVEAINTGSSGRAMHLQNGDTTNSDPTLEIEPLGIGPALKMLGRVEPKLSVFTASESATPREDTILLNPTGTGTTPKMPLGTTFNDSWLRVINMSAFTATLTVPAASGDTFDVNGLGTLAIAAGQKFDCFMHNGVWYVK